MGDSTPICRCRVLYLGSAVPRQSKDGLQGIQEPLRSLYPSEGAIEAKGIDSWLSVWSNGILLENVDENLKQITRFFPIESLHYCAAVRQVMIPERGNTNPEPKFLPLDSPFARMPRAQHPPIFAAILRRTTGIKVLECHVFICKREAAANALVRCCFHAYADNSYARQLETGGTAGAGSVYGSLKGGFASKSNGDLTNIGLSSGNHHHVQQLNSGGWRSRAGSTTTLNSLERQSNGNGIMNGNGAQNINGGSNGSAAEGYTSVKNFYGSGGELNIPADDSASIYNSDENHKVWNGSQDQLDCVGTMENPYEIFTVNSSTLGRPSRARQISVPIDVPPPPMKEEKSKKKNDRKLLKSSGSQSLSGTLIRPRPIHPTMLQRPGPHPGVNVNLIYGPPTVPSAHLSRQYHTISHRAFHSGNPSHPPPMMHTQHMSMHMPVVMPQQYATLQNSRTTSKKKKKDKKNGSGGIPVGMPIVPPIYSYHQAIGPNAQIITTQPIIGESVPLSISNRKLAASMGTGLDDSGNSGAESPGGTGIYRRKGHLNERAFSYSIRQEHRSRSHGSLASLQFNPPDMKKEREIAQLVAGLDLNDSDERSIGPSTMQRQQPTLINGAQNQSIYGNAALYPIYGNGMSAASSFGKPRR